VRGTGDGRGGSGAAEVAVSERLEGRVQKEGEESGRSHRPIVGNEGEHGAPCFPHSLPSTTQSLPSP
jgi:hypothetical protein